MTVQLMDGTTWHKRIGTIGNSFQYHVDYVLIDPDRDDVLPALFSRNRANVMALHDRDHGGPRGAGRGVEWVREVLAENGATSAEDWRILLFAQPRILGTRFTPVSFWFALDRSDQFRAVIAEVNNTYGDRHSYLCATDDFAPILPDDVLHARKVFHVSPFQPLSGQYSFSFGLTEAAVSVKIRFRDDDGGLDAGMAGKLKPLSSLMVLGVLLRRPLGAFRVLSLIHWQALKLWWRGAAFNARPQPPVEEVSR